MERDGTWGVELVPPPASLSWDEAIKRFQLGGPGFDLLEFAIMFGNVWDLTRAHESAALFGPPPVELDPLPTTVTPDFQRKRAELVRRARSEGTEWVRQLSGLQSELVSVTGDQNWDAIIIWENYIAELKVPGRDGPIDYKTYEQPEWNATLAEYLTFVRPVGARTRNGKDAPFDWLLHDITPDPNATRRLTGPIRRLDAA